MDKQRKIATGGSPVEKYQIKAIYSLGKTLNMIDSGKKDDPLHQLVYGITGSPSIGSLTFKQANDVIKELKLRTKGKYAERTGMMSISQQKKVWALMYFLEKYDTKESKVSLGKRLAGIIKKELGISSNEKNPMAWVTCESGGKLIEVIKKYIRNAKTKSAGGDADGEQAKTG